MQPFRGTPPNKHNHRPKERCRSGRSGRSRKPLYLSEVPRVRIPVFPHLTLIISVLTNKHPQKYPFRRFCGSFYVLRAIPRHRRRGQRQAVGGYAGSGCVLQILGSVLQILIFFEWGFLPPIFSIVLVYLIFPYTYHMIYAYHPLILDVGSRIDNQ